MPISCDEILKEMINAAPDEAAAIDQQVSQIEEQQLDYAEKIAAIEECITDVARDELVAYLDGTKLPEIELLYGTPLNIPFSVVYGPNFGTIDFTTGGITDFTIIDVSGTVEYEYLGANWDNDPLIVGWVNDYDFGNDYITHPIGIGAAYGLDPLYDAYEQAKTTILTNKDKILDSVDIFKKYI